MQLAFNVSDKLTGFGSSGGAVTGTVYDSNQFFIIFWSVFKNLYMLAGIILLFFLVAGGAGMILNAGNAEKQKQSSQTLTSAVVGYLIMFAAYWLIKIVEIIFGVKIIL